MKNIKEIMDNSSGLKTQGNGNYLSNVYVNKGNRTNVNGSRKEQLLEELINECDGDQGAIAQLLAEQLDDLKSFPYYLKKVEALPRDLIFDALAQTKRASRQGRIKTSPAKYFVGIIKRIEAK